MDKLRIRRIAKAIKKSRDIKEEKKERVYFITTGSTNLDLAIAQKEKGGIPINRVTNIVGDGSTGKTLLALEIAANVFYNLKDRYSQYKRIIIVYNNSEGVLDFPLEEMYGDDFVNAVEWIHLDTIEGMGRDFKRRFKNLKKGDFIIYIQDSIDAIKSEKEKKDFEESSKKDIEQSAGYGMEKQKYLHRFFRNTCDSIESLGIDKGATLILISQVKQKLDASIFEKKVYRTGGKALDFFTHLVLWLYTAGKLQEKKLNEQVVYGVKTRVKIERSKVGKPWREAIFRILFDYGIDDINSMIDYIYGPTAGGSKSKINWFGENYTRDKLVEHIEEKNQLKRLQKKVIDKFFKIEDLVKPKRKFRFK
jgi:recombination protein RecA